ncbi:serine protease [Caulobacter vibrioides]|uniref:Serine protease n=1 Tax=Caulobacter vibrioides TaxID=155892 RepID=A0A290MTI4_CAUVI|nr:M61 family metallopeptidase [Caulobacter vibrioides]ATC33162.1 serine protease [Caulobacter vibrioides]
MISDRASSVLAVFAAACAWTSGAEAAPKPSLDTYRLAPVVEDGKVRAVSVTITLPADADGETRLRLPTEWGGGERLWRFLKDPAVTGGQLSRPDEKTWVITSKPRARLTVRYQVVSAYDGPPPPDGPNYGQPIIGPDGFYLIGHTIFVAPEGRETDTARFSWDAAGSSLRLSTDLSPLENTPGSIERLGPSVLMAYPDLVETRRDVDGAPLTVAMRGQFNFTAEAFADMAAQSIGAVRAFWGDGRDPFLITLAGQAAPQGWTSYRGTGLDDAFAVISTQNTKLEDYRLFLTHEYLHTWNAERLGGAIQGPREPAGYWFSEGFTDYYARRLALRSGLVDLETFAAAWNEALEAYATSSAIGATNDQIVAKFWSDKAMQKLPYQRGAQLAVLIETKLKPKGGLDRVMLAMRDQAARQQGSRRLSAPETFIPVARKLAGVDLTPELDRFVTGGERILLPSDAFGGCLTVETLTRPAYWLGLDLAETGRGRMIAGVDPAGPAHAAGLRDGMKYLGRQGGKPGDSSIEIGLAIEENGKPRVIRFLPKGPGEVTVQRIKLPATLAPDARSACVKAVAG